MTKITQQHIQEVLHYADEFPGSGQNRELAEIVRRLQSSSPLVAVTDNDALAEFTEYFVKNYPGPNTIITSPHWHAPKIFAAAKHALATQVSPQATVEPLTDEQIVEAIRHIDNRALKRVSTMPESISIIRDLLALAGGRKPFTREQLEDLKGIGDIAISGISATPTASKADTVDRNAVLEEAISLCNFLAEDWEKENDLTKSNAASYISGSLQGLKSATPSTIRAEPKRLLTAGSPLEDFEEFAAKLCAEGKLIWAGFRKDADGFYRIPIINPAEEKLIRAILAEPTGEQL